MACDRHVNKVPSEHDCYAVLCVIGPWYAVLTPFDQVKWNVNRVWQWTRLAGEFLAWVYSEDSSVGGSLWKDYECSGMSERKIRLLEDIIQGEEWVQRRRQRNKRIQSKSISGLMFDTLMASIEQQENNFQCKLINYLLTRSSSKCLTIRTAKCLKELSKDSCRSFKRPDEKEGEQQSQHSPTIVPSCKVVNRDCDELPEEYCRLGIGLCFKGKISRFLECKENPQMFEYCDI